MNIDTDVEAQQTTLKDAQKSLEDQKESKQLQQLISLHMELTVRSQDIYGRVD